MMTTVRFQTRSFYVLHCELGFVLLSKTPQELGELISSYEAPKYRSSQILSSLLHGAKSIDDMNLVLKPLLYRLLRLLDRFRRR